MTLREALVFATKTLSVLNPEDAPLESEVLLRHTLKVDRARLFLRMDEALTAEQELTFQLLLRRRLVGEPIAYITSEREFFGLDFYINQSVLIPRPETELLVGKSLSIAGRGNIATIADIGTGSGVIAVVLALRLPAARIYATDISGAALEIAGINAERHGVSGRIHLLQGDLLMPLPEPCDLIVANLPYVRQEEIPPFEPQIALDGGEDGLKLIRRFCIHLKDRLAPEGYALMEVGQGQSRMVAEFVLGLYPEADIEIYPDLAGIERVIKAKVIR